MPRPPAYPDESSMEHPELRERLLRDEPPVDVDALLDRTRRAIEAERGPVARLRRTSTPARVAAVLGAAAVAVAGTALVAPRPDLGQLPLAALVLSCGALLAAAVGGVAVAMRPPWMPEIPRWQAGALLAVALLAPAAAAALPLAPAVRLPPEQWVGATLACLAYGSAVAAGVAGAWRAVEQRTRAGALRWAVALASGGAVGNAALLLHCGITDPTHDLLGHAAVGAILAAAGAVAAGLTGRRAA